MNRVLVIDKPRGLTSHDVVARVRRLSKVRKVGHAGTLDPAATGVLIVLVGKATRLAQFFVELEKGYRGRIVLGVATDTQDATGKVESTSDPSRITRAQIEDAFSAFEGETTQVPPMVSALKRDGTPLYVLARRGEVVERQARPVSIRGLRVLSIDMPEVEFEMVCSRGTYVRTLAADIGEALGCGAHLGELARTAVGPFTLDDASPLDRLKRDDLESGTVGRSMFEALTFMPELRVTEAEEDRLSTGGSIDVDSERLPEASGEHLRLSLDGTELIAVGKRGAPAESPGAEGEDIGAHSDVAGERVTVRPIRVFTEPL